MFQDALSQIAQNDKPRASDFGREGKGGDGRSLEHARRRTQECLRCSWSARRNRRYRSRDQKTSCDLIIERYTLDRVKGAGVVRSLFYSLYSIIS